MASATAYRAAYLYCDTHGADATGLPCRACATAVLFNRGEWDLAVDVCRDDVLAEPVNRGAGRAPSAHACSLGLIHALRGEAAKGQAARHLEGGGPVPARIELVAVELLSAWGLAVLEAQSGAVTAATDRIRQALVQAQRNPGAALLPAVPPVGCHVPHPRTGWRTMPRPARRRCPASARRPAGGGSRRARPRARRDQAGRRPGGRRERASTGGRDVRRA